MGIRISDMPNLTGSKSNDNSLLLITDLSGSTSDLQNRKLKVSTFNQIFSNNKILDGLSSYENFFGSGEEGDITFSTSANIPSENHGEIVVKQYRNCSINSGVTLTTSNPCRGLVIFCTGNLTIDGTLTMTAKGGGVGNKATEFNYNIADTSLSFNTSSNGGSGVQSWNFSPSGSVWYPRYRQNIPIRNPVVGASVSSNGIAGIFSCGGGGGGVTGNSSCPTGGAFGGTGGIGGSGSLFAGGGGGGGGAGNYCSSGGSGDAAIFEIAGRGGQSSTVGGGGGGGAGNPAGAGAGGAGGGGTGSGGGSGGGGLLIIIVRGNVTITGTISSNGGNGGNGGFGSPSGPSAGGGGGSAGGGRLIIVYGGTYSNTGTVQANGGSGGGTNGGAGVITIQKIDQ